MKTLQIGYNLLSKATLVLCACLGILSPALASGNLSSERMVQLLRSANILKADASLHATYEDQPKRVVVLTDRLPKAKDNDCKIDSVMIAKTLMDGYPEDINVVRVIFDIPETANTKQVDVTKVDVKAYASGAVKANELLASLNLIDTSADSTAMAQSSSSGQNVVPGPLLDQRMILLSRIEKLRLRGTGVKPFQTVFEKIEQEAGQGDQRAVKQDVDFLSDKLHEQEVLLKESNLPISHSGIGRKNDFPGYSAVLGKRRHGNIVQNGPGSQMAGSANQPPQDDRFRNQMQTDTMLVRSINRRRFDPTELQSLLGQARDYSQSGNYDKAWECLKQFESVKQRLGL